MQTSLIYNSEDTICAISTPAGTGGIAVIRMSGRDAFAITDKVWKGKSIAAATTHTAHLGLINDPDTDEVIDQAVATIFRGPHSFTGDDTVELSIHGSRWIQRRVLTILQSQGARLALPGEFTRRAYTTGHLDLAEAEAVADVIAASSQAAHRLAMSQLRGEYSKHIAGLRAELVDLTALLELELDFSEEDLEFASRTRLNELASSIHIQLSRLADSYKAGANIKDGIPVAIIGPTNAGKSSLLNALLNDERAIVSDIHGTTRDIVEDTIEIGPYLIRFRDTAGLRTTTDTIENIGIERSQAAARSASVVIYMVDPLAATDVANISNSLDGIAQSDVIIAVNKADIAPTEATETAKTLAEAFPSATLLTISAKERTTLASLCEAILYHIETQVPDSENDVIVTNARHAEALRNAADAASAVSQAIDAGLPADLIAQDLRATIHYLSSITGEITPTEVLSTIFSRFCIGK
jgi:tRNA modification GTPase